MSQRRCVSFQGALWLTVTVVAGPLHAEDLSFTGYARDPRSGELLYVESHLLRRFDTVGETRIVTYRCSAEGSAFARKELTYGDVREEPDFTFVDARSGYTEGLRRTTDGRRVFQQDDARSPRREARIPLKAVIVADAGFDEFVRKHWVELEAGKTVRFPFLVPSRLDFLNFKIKKHRDTRVNDMPASAIRLNLSGVLGWFLPYIEVTYRKSDQTLQRYEGLTNIPKDDGGNHVAVITFPPRERKTVAAVDLARARGETLTARCP
jgi:hypothetical protein